VTANGLISTLLIDTVNSYLDICGQPCVLSESASNSN